MSYEGSRLAPQLAGVTCGTRTRDTISLPFRPDNGQRVKEASAPPTELRPPKKKGQSAVIEAAPSGVKPDALTGKLESSARTTDKGMTEAIMS